MKRRNMTRARRLQLVGMNVARMRAYLMASAYNTVSMGRVAARRYAEHHGDFTARIDLTIGQWVDICESWDYLCAYCGRPPVTSLKRPRLCMDHVVPIYRGGDHSAENVLPTCMACNSSKGQILLLEWACVEGGIWTASLGRTARKAYLNEPIEDASMRAFEIFQIAS
jgi:hypothetical protein